MVQGPIPAHASGLRLRRLRVVIRGAVQGVGFRPFVYRLATQMGLPGWVINSAQGVFVEVEGAEERLHEFLRRIESDKPRISFIQSLESSFLDPAGFTRFEILTSEGGEKTALVMPDVATCSDCLAEINDPANRRYRYPFTNCTNCGPRFTIIESLPYDRPRTTMKAFQMCVDCQREYYDPRDRRFHAQPNACPGCGPQLGLWDGEGIVLATLDAALKLAADHIRSGRIVAVKGLGGFHLACDARNEQAVIQLRRRKQREEKPFALMYPSYAAVEQDCAISNIEARLLRSPESPIVLLRRREGSSTSALAPSIAPRNPYLGVMLPYTPLHHLLLAELGFPVVATSGNISDEPICTDEHEARRRLHGIADAFLVHNRPILRHVDDSIAREMSGRELVLRRARGFAPLPIVIGDPGRRILAVGAHQKNSVAMSVGPQVFISQHIGDLETVESLQAFEHVIDSFRTLYEIEPAVVASDLHPGYSSTQHAGRMGIEHVRVQHHYAHALSCMAENQVQPPALAVSWDGSGFGPDHTIWGGEFLRITASGFERVGHLRPFRLPGGDKAVKEPRRVAMSLLYEMFGDAAFDLTDVPTLGAFASDDLGVVRSMLKRGINAPVTTSAGRLFDAVASLINLRQVCRFEGQAAMELEFAIPAAPPHDSYQFGVNELDGVLIADWEPVVRAILRDHAHELAAGLIAARFHNALATMIATLARQVGEEKVLLTGGCFQNRYLTECVIGHISRAGLRPYWHQRVPPNDGGIALGQIVAASRKQG